MATFVQASLALDFGTLFVVAICVTSLLGLFLLYAWTQERIMALAWWGVAYLLGGASGALWHLSDTIAPLAASLSTTLLFVATGMIWSAAHACFTGGRFAGSPPCSAPRSG